jgi:hypothetical protein
MIVEMGKVDRSEIFRIEPGIYLVRLSGHLTFAGSNQINELIQRDQPTGKRAVLYETTREFTGYDPELRTLQNNPALSGTAHIGIITGNPLLRMVTTAVALGLRTATGVPMSSYGSMEAAVEGAKKALAKK